ncbi:MAG: proline--tRNA ligase [Myxococcales bacterium]|nr:proline--tRNA ligase [Myxococcales bacterium]MCB9645428.1 proline--tRNA ligase [Deltaproteobacteria bacterium]
MAKQDKDLSRITPRAESYPDWYQDVIREGQLAEVAGIVKGCMVIKPHGYAIWEKIQRELDDRFKATGVQNAYFPLLIPESFIKREAEHVEGFSPELAVVTIAGGEQLEEPYVIRPTSETIIGHFFAQWIQSHRDLPMLINQWANVMRWEKRTRMFLRTGEFLWQEGHTAHSTHEEAVERVIQMLNVYADFAQDFMAMPVIRGRKSETEKFAGALASYTIEAMMQDGKALQSGTSHDLGQNFGKAFDVKFQSKEGQLDYVWQTSWGVSTRLVGGLVMSHSDDNGLVIPPKLAPIQAVIVPFFRKNEAENEQVREEGKKLQATLQAEGVAAVFDDKEGQPGPKFYHYERLGVPLRFGVGPRDIANRTAEFKRRDQAEKRSVSLDGLVQLAKDELAAMQRELFSAALARREANTVRLDTWDDFKGLFDADEGKFVFAHWDGTKETEAKVKAETGATIRCIPMEGQGFEAEPGECVVTGKPSAQRVIWAKAY